MKSGNQLNSFIIHYKILIRDVGIVFFGSTFSQLINLVTLPVLARLYSPQDFGLFALYLSILSILTFVITLRYEMAIVISKTDEDAVNIIALVFFIVSCLSLVMGAVVSAGLLFKDHIPVDYWQIFLYIPISLFFMGVYQIFYCWFNRKADYKFLSVSRFLGVIMTVLVSVVIGLSGGKRTGLILGNIAGQLICVLSVLVWFLKKHRRLLSFIAREKIKRVALQHYRFPLFSVPADSLNALSYHAPVLLLTRFFDSTTTGFFSLAQKLVGVPISLISSSIADVFRQQASMEYQSKGNCEAIFKKTFRLLFILSTIFFTVFFLLGPYIFTSLLGPQWQTVGEYARILVFYYAVYLLYTPLSYVFSITNKQNYDLIGQVLLFLASACSLSFGGVMQQPKLAILLYSVSCSAIYLFFFLCTSYNFAKVKISKGSL